MKLQQHKGVKLNEIIFWKNFILKFLDQRCPKWPEMRFLKCFEKSTHGTFSEFLLKLQQLKGLKVAQKKVKKDPK